MSDGIKCGQCERPLVSGWWWRNSTPAEREVWKADGFVAHRARGLCDGCYSSARRAGEALVDHERRNRPAQEVVDEWEWLRVSGFSRAKAAEHMGVKKNTLDTALLRARKKGLVAA